MMERDIMLQALHLLGVLHLPDRILGIQYLQDALHAGQSLLYGISRLAQILDRLQGGIEDHQIIDKEIGIYSAGTSKDEPSAKPQYDDYHHGAQEFAHGMGCTLAQGHTSGYVTIVVIDFREALHHLTLGYECLDDTETSQGLLYLADAVTQAGLHQQRTGLEALAYRTYSPCQQRHNEQGEEGQLPTDADECGQINDDEDGVLHNHVERTADAGIHLVDIRGYAGEDVALAFLREESQR